MLPAGREEVELADAGVAEAVAGRAAEEGSTVEAVLTVDDGEVGLEEETVFMVVEEPSLRG